MSQAALPAPPRVSLRVRPPRTPYFYRDPIRISAMICTGLLMWVTEVPYALGLFAVAVSQVNGVAMVIDLLGRGWSSKWGGRSRTTVLTSRLAMDWVNVSVCSLVGAMLLMRLFGPPALGPALVSALGWLTLAVALIPDIRVCRMVLPEDARQAGHVLTRGYFFRDPVKLGALVAITVLSCLDVVSLSFLFISMVMLQFNSFMILVDKYLSEIEIEGRGPRGPFRAVRLFLNRDGQRLMLVLLPLAFIPLRLTAPGNVAQYVAAGVAGLIIIPDLWRLGGRLVAFTGSRRAAVKPGLASAR